MALAFFSYLGPASQPGGRGVRPGSLPRRGFAGLVKGEGRDDVERLVELLCALRCDKPELKIFRASLAQES